LHKSGKIVAIIKKALWKINFNFVKFVPMIFVNFIVIVIIVPEKTKGGFTFITPLEKFAMLVILYIIKLIIPLLWS